MKIVTSLIIWMCTSPLWGMDDRVDPTLRKAYVKHQFLKAVEIFERLPPEKHTLPTIDLGAAAYFYIGHYERSAELGDDVLRRKGERVTYLDYGRVGAAHANAGHYERALELFEQVLRDKPEPLMAEDYYNAAFCAAQLGRMLMVQQYRDAGLALCQLPYELRLIKPMLETLILPENPSIQ